MSIIGKWRALRPDLRKHIIAGLAIGLSVTLCAGPWTPPLIAALLGAVAGIVVGWLKEYFWDKRGHGTVDRLDYLMTGRAAILGGALGGVIITLSGIGPGWGWP